MFAVSTTVTPVVYSEPPPCVPSAIVEKRNGCDALHCIAGVKLIEVKVLPVFKRVRCLARSIDVVQASDDYDCF